MRTVQELRALAVQLSRADDVHVQLDQNDYGWHVVVRAGQPVECAPVDHGEYRVYDAWSGVDAPIMVAATAPTLNAAVQHAYSTLEFEVQTFVTGEP